MADLLSFCLLTLTKYLEILSVRMHISNTKEYLLPILYTRINYNHPMNHIKWHEDLIPNGCLFAILFAQIDKIFENFVRPDEYLPTPLNNVFQYFTHALPTILLWILWSFVRIKFKMVDLLPFLFAQIAKIFENFVLPDEYLQHQWIFVSNT